MKHKGGYYMSLVDKLEKLKRERKSLYIPELDETVYWYPMTAGERQRILNAAGFKYSRDTVFLDNAKYKTSLIIEKLEDKDGKKIFQNIPEHKDLLMNRINDELLTRIANAIDPPRTEEEVIDEAKNESENLSIEG
jgi:hypothetical protein